MSQQIKRVIESAGEPSRNDLWLDPRGDVPGLKTFRRGKWVGVDNTDLQPIRDDISVLQENVNTLSTSKVDKVAGKGLSTNDFTDELKTKYNNAAPSTSGTDGQVISLQSGAPTWVDPTEGSIIDAALSGDSTNPVQNKVITSAISQLGQKVTAPKVLYKKEINAVTGANPTRVIDINSGTQVKVKFTGLPTDIPSSTYIIFGFNNAGGQYIGGEHNVYATDNWESDYITLTDDAVLAWVVFYGNDWDGQPAEWKIFEKEYVNDVVQQLEEDKVDKTSITQTVENDDNKLPSSSAVYDKVTAPKVLYKKEINAVTGANPTRVIDINSGTQVKVKFTGLPTDIPSSTYIIFGFNNAGGQYIGGEHNVYATDNWESDYITLTDDAVLAWVVFYGNDWDGQPAEWKIFEKGYVNDVVQQLEEDKVDKTSITQTVENDDNKLPSSSAVYDKVTAQNFSTYTKSVTAVRGANPTQRVNIPQGAVVKFRLNNAPTLSASNYIQYGLNDANGHTISGDRKLYATDNWKSDYIELTGDAVLAWLQFFGDDWTGEEIEWCIDELNTFFISDTPSIGNIGRQKYKPNFNIPISEVGYGIDYDSGEVVNSGYDTVVLGPVDIDNNFRFIDIKNRISAAGVGVVFYTENGTKLKPVGSTDYSDGTNELLEVPSGAVSFRCTAIANKEHEINFYTEIYEKSKYKLEEIFGSEIGGKSCAFGNAKIATNYNIGDGSSLSPYISNDNTGGINTAIGESSEKGGKVIVPVGEYLISSPVIITHDCINIDGEIWNYPDHPNGVYESRNGSKLKLASNDIPAIKLSQIWNGWRIAQIGVAGIVSNGGTKGLFDKNNPGVNCGLLINKYTDQFEVNRVSFEGLAAGIVGVNCTWDAGIISRVNADGCNIGIYLESVSSYYFKIKDCILSDCPAFGMYIKSTSLFEGLEICGNVMVRNGGGLTAQQITDFGGDEEVASCIIKNLSVSTFHHNYIHSPGVWMNPTSGTPTAETQERYGIIFSAVNSTFEGNNISGGKGNVIRGNSVNVISNVMQSKLILDGENHLVTGNVMSEIVVNADGCTVINNRCTSSKITINGDDNYIVCPQGYTVVDNGNNNVVIRQ